MHVTALSSSGRAGAVLVAVAAALWRLSSVADAVAAVEDEDEVVVVVSADNPLREMPRLHLADLYLGRTARFPDGEPAVPIDQAPDSPARTRFYELYLGRSQAEIKAHWSKIIFTGRGRPPRDVPAGADVKRILAEDPRAIGYIERRLVDDSVRVVRLE